VALYSVVLAVALVEALVLVALHLEVLVVKICLVLDVVQRLPQL